MYNKLKSNGTVESAVFLPPVLGTFYELKNIVIARYILLFEWENYTLGIAAAAAAFYQTMQFSQTEKGWL